MSEEKKISEPETDPASDSPTLADVLAKYDIRLPDDQIEMLDRYCRALWEWNGKLNLTRHDNYEKFVTRDLVDSIRLASHLQEGEHVLDVGTGGGVPGVVLAILRPDLQVELCDATEKKAKAVGAILDQIGLDLNIWHAKAEDLLKAHRFHTLAIRAVSKLERLLAIFAPVWFAFDRILMIKGPAWVEERGEARHFGRLTNLALRKIDEYTNPGVEHQSVILQVCQKKRLAEIEKRAADLAAGLPIRESAEFVAVETAPAPHRSAPPRRPKGSRPYGASAKGRFFPRDTKRGGRGKSGPNGKPKGPRPPRRPSH
ncbi:MAG: 16S rRNA (guanine(527)-N(7))-methyltransferase RsmG [Thermoguttaceae bacterium]|nr:16S rRNA (guanine(527)-N(7))-methyltransferase RsmG [Thermoguttaceae bacterium]